MFWINLPDGSQLSVGFTVFMVIYFFCGVEFGQNQNTNTDLLLEILKEVKKIKKT